MLKPFLRQLLKIMETFPLWCRLFNFGIYFHRPAFSVGFIVHTTKQVLKQFLY